MNIILFKNKYLNVFLIICMCLILTFSLFFGQIVEVEAALPLVVVYGVKAIVVGVLSVMGLTVLDANKAGYDGLSGLADEVFSSMDMTTVERIEAYSNGTMSSAGFNLSTIWLPFDIVKAIKDIAISLLELPTLSSGEIYDGTFSNFNSGVTSGIFATASLYYEPKQSFYDKRDSMLSSYPYWIIITQPADQFSNRCIMSTQPFEIESSNFEKFHDSIPGLFPKIYFSTNLNMRNTICLYDEELNNHVGVVGYSECYFGYIRASNFPLKYADSGDVALNGEYLVAGINFAYDGTVAQKFNDWGANTSDQQREVPLTLPTSVNPLDPSQTIPDNNISADTVSKGLQALDDGFANGQTITDVSGNVIDNVPDIVKNPVSDQVINPPIEGTVSGIQSLVKAILAALTGVITSIQSIATSIADFFKWDGNFDVNFDALKVGIPKKFPFCIPFDFINLITTFAKQPTDFQFKIKLDTSYFKIDHTVDLSIIRIPLMFFRYLVVIFFTYILISRTKDFMKW